MVFLFVNIVLFPPLKEGSDEQFKQWFKESNELFSKFDGFISRRLLVTANGAYAAIVEHESEESFMRMHKSAQREEVHKKMMGLFEGEPKPSFYNVVI